MFLEKQAKLISQVVIDGYKKAGFGKVAPTVERPSSPDDDADRILEELDLSDWVALSEDVSPELLVAYREGGKGALLELDISDNEMFDVINDQAVEFANDRAAELVGMKYVDGELVPNPDAEWAITESTREQLRDLAVKALTDGMSVDALKTAIIASQSFSDMRAEMIAHDLGQLVVAQIVQIVNVLEVTRHVRPLSFAVRVRRLTRSAQKSARSRSGMFAVVSTAVAVSGTPVTHSRASTARSC